MINRVSMLAAVILGLGLVAMTNRAEARSCAETSVLLDIGHFLEEPGAISARGLPELFFNVDLARAIRDALVKQGFTRIKVINEDGTIRALRERSRIANEGGFDLFLSVHHDSMQAHLLTPWTYEGLELRYGDQYSGFSLFVSRKNPQVEESARLAKLIGKRLVAKGFNRTLHHAANIPGERKPLVDRKHGVYYYDNLVVLKTTKMPAVLIEGGVILNRAEEMRIRQSPQYHRDFAQAVAQAVTDYCGG